MKPKSNRRKTERSANQLKANFVFLLLSTISLTTYSQDKDSTEIIRLLKNDYKTLENLDSKKHIENCTDDYMLIENGEIWDIKKEIEILFKPQTNYKIVRQDKFDFKKIKIEKPYAYAVYDLRAEITINGNTKKHHWTESTIFYKVSDRWKIKLIHSTKIND